MPNLPGHSIFLIVLSEDTPEEVLQKTEGGNNQRLILVMGSFPGVSAARSLLGERPG
jgi:hypothetical protein